MEPLTLGYMVPWLVPGNWIYSETKSWVKKSVLSAATSKAFWDSARSPSKEVPLCLHLLLVGALRPLCLIHLIESENVIPGFPGLHDDLYTTDSKISLDERELACAQIPLLLLKFESRDVCLMSKEVSFLLDSTAYSQVNLWLIRPAHGGHQGFLWVTLLTFYLL